MYIYENVDSNNKCAAITKIYKIPLIVIFQWAAT